MLFFFATVVEGMSHKIDRSFKLIFWGIELGEFDVNAEINDKNYSISTTLSGKSVINFISRYKISSGAFGKISNNGDLIPLQSVSRWNTRGKFRQTKLRYSNDILIEFESSPELTKRYHIDNPIGLSNTVDPVSLTLWLLKKPNMDQLCNQKFRILDGFRLSELSFEKKISSQDMIICLGKIKRIKGFKDSDLNKKPLKFSIYYSPMYEKEFKLTKIDIETIFGKMSLEEF